MERNLDAIISQMTLEEKAGLCSGRNFWQSKAVERLGIPTITMSDGPHGLRLQEGSADNLGINESKPATCFPSGVGLASSWDRSLVERMGQALGQECLAEGVGIVLGPAANIKRSPLCGRNFEYLSEDPYLSSEMAAAHIRGVQSQGVGTSLKHYAVNNQEHRRMTVDAVLDERTLREIYLASFEGAVVQEQPWTVMCAYNKVGGEYCCQHPFLLTEVLRDEWGFEGFVVSDWGATDERVPSLAAGMELEMPPIPGSDQKIVEAVRSGELPEAILDTAVKRLLKVIFKAADGLRADAAVDFDAQHAIARSIAGECMVLLKNDGILPLKKEGKVAVIGAFAKQPRFQGGGSSHISPSRLDDIEQEIQKTAPGASVTYAPGYILGSEQIDEALLEEACSAAQAADVAIVFAGLPDNYESEGYDRTHLDMPDSHNRLIEAVAQVNPHTVVVLSNGSPVVMPWIHQVPAVLEAYLGGQALGGAIADILFGDVNPSGKLAETFPQRLSDTPCFLTFPGEGDREEYREGIFVGYRYYDKKQVEPLFPFGHGLSYTRFAYTHIALDHTEMKDNEPLTVSVTVKNIGDVAGKEVVQLYVHDQQRGVIRPDKELKGFEKIFLHPGEEKTVTFTLGRRAFAYYDVNAGDWRVQNGTFTILAGTSARDIRLSADVMVHAEQTQRLTVHRNTTLGELMQNPVGKAVVEQMMQQFSQSLGTQQQNAMFSHEMVMAMLGSLPLRAIGGLSGGMFTEEAMNGLIAQVNAAQAQTE